MRVRSGVLAAWTSAWLAGEAAYDDVVARVTGDDEPHRVTGLPGAAGETPLGWALPVLRERSPEGVRAVLPVAGDPRGLPGPGPFTGAALITGEGVVAGMLGLVPEVRTHTSGSGDTFETVLWRVFALPELTAQRYHDEPSAAEAEAELSAALMAATTALTKLDVAQWRPELAGALQALRKPDNSTDLPPGYDARARRLYARASVLDRVLALAELSAPGVINGYEAQQRDAALRPLTQACRRALVAACNAPMI